MDKLKDSIPEMQEQAEKDKAADWLELMFGAKPIVGSHRPMATRMSAPKQPNWNFAKSAENGQ